MKSTKKNTNASSRREKVKNLLKSAKLPKSSSKKRVASGKSTAAKVPSTRVEPLREGTIDMNKMPFPEQAGLIFNPLGGVNPKYVVGAKKEGK
jgi:hypothetical protein